MIHKRSAFSTNQRKEITSKSKYYFLDNGIRNGVILQFNKLEDRNDIGKLFENFFVMERLKYLSNNSIHRNSFFWRTYDGQEIDLVEEGDGKISGIEIKYSDAAKFKTPKAWAEFYKESKIQIIHKDNYLDLLL